MSKAESRTGGEALSKRDASAKKGGVLVMFRGNRSFELHAGREVYRFGPHETRELPRAVLETDGFKQASRYFVIKG